VSSVGVDFQKYHRALAYVDGPNNLGSGLLGRVIDPLGQPLDGHGPSCFPMRHCCMGRR
jgi:flagellar biosynthesis/type III secretory pathway ATPase